MTADLDPAGIYRQMLRIREAYLLPDEPEIVAAALSVTEGSG